MDKFMGVEIEKSYFSPQHKLFVQTPVAIALNAAVL
jgi:hypothetical protein